MLDQYISSSGYFAFPSFTVAIYTLLLAVFLSAILAITYKVTFQGESFPNNFFQAIVLSSTVSSMVMMAVGDNLAVGFGVLGAVSIIRFRTLMRNPRNIIFIFASLSVGITTGVFGYAVAISGTVIFCIVVFLLHFSSFGKEADQKFELVFSISDPSSLQNFENNMVNQKVKAVISRIRHMETGDVRYTYLVGLKLSADRDHFFRSVVSVEGLDNVRFEHKDNDEQL
jgi:uncharacterized membrane protein YhiD involved in acid resistance